MIDMIVRDGWTLTFFQVENLAGRKMIRLEAEKNGKKYEVEGRTVEKAIERMCLTLP